MCGRFTRKYTWAQLHDLLNLRWPDLLEVRPSYNVAPTQTSPVVRLDAAGARGLADARWGLIPAWADDLKFGARTINARAETVATSPAFRTAFAKRRCIVPVSGFYEWQAVEGQKVKQPWYIYRADGAPLCFAGLWERWEKGETPMESFTIVTTTANDFVRPVHDRMPVVLEPESWSAWLDPATTADGANALLRPAADGVLTSHRVSTRVNSPKINEADLTNTVAA